MNWYETIKDESFESVLSRCGHTLKGKRFKNCPACGASRTKRDRRPPVGIFGEAPKLKWHCNNCQESGTKIDIISYYLYSCPASELDSFKMLRTYVDASATIKPLTKSICHIKPPEYPPVNEVEKVLKGGVKYLRNIQPTPNLTKFLKTRNLHQDKIPCGLANPYWGGWDDLTTVKASNGKDTYWYPRQWAREYGLIFPLVDHNGNIRSMLGRTWYNRSRKTTVPISYTTKGLLLANHQARNWMKEKNFVEKVIICEGEMDYATVCQEWDGIVLGIRSGSIDVCQDLPWMLGTDVYIATDFDEKGDEYAEKLKTCVGRATPLRVRFDNEQ
tara:strand:+ start:3668 stop:4657 length:990 start_codon:yes stop_codon:yes gene_type:complete